MKTKHISTNAFRLLLCLSLSFFAVGMQPAAKAADTGISTNNPPITTQSAPTYDQTVEWLKKNCHFENVSHSDALQKTYTTKSTIEKFDSWRMTIKKTDGSGPDNYMITECTIDFSDLKPCILNKIGDGYTVRVETIDSNQSIRYKEWTKERGGEEIVSERSIDGAYIFDGNLEMANRVIKACNRLIELAPKDDLFK